MYQQGQSMKGRGRALDLGPPPLRILEGGISWPGYISGREHPAGTLLREAKVEELRLGAGVAVVIYK